MKNSKTRAATDDWVIKVVIFRGAFGQEKKAWALGEILQKKKKILHLSSFNIICPKIFISSGTHFAALKSYCSPKFNSMILIQYFLDLNHLFRNIELISKKKKKFLLNT